MATLTENINSTITSLEAIKQAVIAKGGNVPTGTPLSAYAGLILAMPAGTYTGCKSTEWISANLEQDATPYYQSPTDSYIVTPTNEWTITGTTATENYSSSGTATLYWLYDGLHNIKYSVTSGGFGYSNTTYYDFKSYNYNSSTVNSNRPAYSMASYGQSSVYLYRLLPIITVPSNFIVESNTKIDIVGKYTLGNSSTVATYEFKYRLWTPAN